MAAFSMSAIIAGVASTGMSPEPMAMAVTASVTVNWLVCVNPVIESLVLLLLANLINLLVVKAMKSSFSAHIPQIWQYNGLKFAYCNILL
jgi:hypothetical protein